MNAKQLLERMADIEARIAKIYERFATEFRDVLDIGDLWVSMGREELRHAEHLSLAMTAAPDTAVAPEVAAHVGQLEAVLGTCEREVAHTVQLQEALRVTVDLEAAETDHLHTVLGTIGDWAKTLAAAPELQHHHRHVLEHAIDLFATPGVRQRMRWQRFRG